MIDTSRELYIYTYNTLSCSINEDTRGREMFVSMKVSHVSQLPGPGLA